MFLRVKNSWINKKTIANFVIDHFHKDGEEYIIVRFYNGNNTLLGETTYKCAFTNINTYITYLGMSLAEFLSNNDYDDDDEDSEYADFVTTFQSINTKAFKELSKE